MIKTIAKQILMWSLALLIGYGIAYNLWKSVVWTLEGENQVLYRELEEANRIISEYRLEELRYGMAE